MAISLVIIDGTIVNTIFPKVIEDLALTSTEVQWVQESYVLVFASTLLVWGSLADKIGRKRLLLIGPDSADRPRQCLNERTNTYTHVWFTSDSV